MNGDRRFRAAVIGCGFIGGGGSVNPETVGVFSHAEAYTASQHTELSALCDASEVRLNQLAKQYPNVPVFTDVGDCLSASRPEVVSIATPDATHFDFATQVCNFPGVRGILIEKPVALTHLEAQELVNTARTNGVTLAVNYSRRYTSRFQMIAEQIKAGKIGEIQSVLGLYTKGILHNGSHWIDLLDMFGLEIDSVAALSKGLFYGTDPTPDVYFKLQSGSAFLAGCSEKNFTVFEMDLIGTRGRIRILDGGHGIEVLQLKPSSNYSGYTVLEQRSGSACGDMKDAMLHAINDLVSSIDAGASTKSTGSQAVRLLAIVEKIAKSLDQNSATIKLC